MTKKIQLIWLLLLSLPLHAGTPIPAKPAHSKLSNDFESPAWEQTYKLDAFKVVIDHQTLEDPKYKTDVRMTFDGKNVIIRVRATDPDIQTVEAGSPPVDSYLNSFPKGDRIELMIRSSHTHIIAFDCNGTKYHSKDYAKEKYCWYSLKTRKTSQGWDAIVTVELDKLGFARHKKKRDITFQVARHAEHGNAIERSFAKGRSFQDFNRLTVGEVKK